jgi:hypothetical protein
MSLSSGRGRLRQFGVMLLIVMLMSFLRIPVYGEPSTKGLIPSGGNGTKFYSEGEVQGMIEELTETATEAIETAAAEAAKAAALASLEREAAALAEAQRWEREYRGARRAGVKAAVITGVICLLSGFVAGAVVVAGNR